MRLPTRLLRSPIVPLLAAGALALAARPGDAGAQVPETLLPGDPAVDASRLAPALDSTRIVFLRGGEERPGALQVEELRVVGSDGDAFLRQVLRVVSARGALVDTTDYRLPGLEPLRHRSRGAASGMRDMILDYGPGTRIDGRVEHPDSGTVPVAATPPHPVFDPGASLLLVRALPLEPGFARRIPFFNHETRDVRWTEIEVLRSDAPPAGEAPAGVLVVRQRLHDGRDVFLWLNERDHRVLEVRAPLGGDSEMRGRPVGGPGGG